MAVASGKATTVHPYLSAKEWLVAFSPLLASVYTKHHERVRNNQQYLHCSF